MLRQLFGVLVLGVFLAVSAQASNRVVVYSALENEEIEAYMRAARAALPDLDIQVLRISTGALAARVKAESRSPQADLIWGTAATALDPLAKEGILEPYRPRDARRIPARFKSDQDFWYGMTMYIGGVAINTRELHDLKLPLPTSWKDLTDPRYRGLVVMPNPAESGTGFVHVNSWLSIFGEKEGWEYMEQLNSNVRQYTSSGSAPARLAGSGEAVAGLSLVLSIQSQANQGFPVQLIFPKEGVGYELEANALVKGGPNPAAAKRFLDWAISENAMKSYAVMKAGVTMEGIATSEKLPQLGDIPLISMDFNKVGETKDAVVREWTRRFAR
ncbi:ABC transporter substrate-binding protein [Desulfurispirillum indicum]|uniref:ABC transporter substrate-binding protein n=1 Tax=Desulfurispirillum indicum TaxID=936456 RepID=UPI001CF99E3E|nr:ABC transporter substrate-binding protein [Desulfurispirillum indicum]UCZ56201.1 ABC transporter substrate-binding protein [Desulfurispirillum indicum]